MSSFTRGAPTETADSTATGPWPRFYKVTIISDGRLGDAAHTDRRITLKARSRLKNGSGPVGEHPAPILAVEKIACNPAVTSGSSPRGPQMAEFGPLGAI